MDPEKKAAVMALFAEMGKQDQIEEDKKLQRSKGDTIIVNSTIVVCVPDQAADILASLFRQS